jgi:phage shock protein C
MEDVARYCSQCGTATPNVAAEAAAAAATAAQAHPQPPYTANAAAPAYRPLVRLRSDRWIGGVCSGLARYWGLDPALVRILFIALAICPILPAFIPYIVCWIVMPQEPEVAAQTTVLQRA